MKIIVQRGKKKRKHDNEDDTETTMIELQHTQKNETAEYSRELLVTHLFI